MIRAERHAHRIELLTYLKHTRAQSEEDTSRWRRVRCGLDTQRVTRNEYSFGLNKKEVRAYKSKCLALSVLTFRTTAAARGGRHPPPNRRTFVWPEHVMPNMSQIKLCLVENDRKEGKQ